MTPILLAASSAPAVRTLTYCDPTEVAAYALASQNREAELLAEIERLKAGNSTPPVQFSFDLSNLPGTPDAAIPDAKKLADKKAALGVKKATNVRVFFGTKVPRWDDERIQALNPAVGDTFILSTLTTDWAALTKFYKATPDAWRQGNYMSCYGHEREANLLTAAALKSWLDGNKRMTDVMVGANVGLTSDHFGKIGLYYSQEEDQRDTVPTREEMYGGQDWGFFGEDCYHPRARLARGFYTAPERLFGPILDFATQIGRPTIIPEWGGERAKGDTDGTGRAKAIADGGTYLKARNGQNGLRIIGANWWWGGGIRDGQIVGHDLGIGTPEVAAYKKLAQG